jgi:tetratricopeptide (TPR) repeat protein
MADRALKKGEYDKAAALSRSALKIDPAKRAVHGQLGQALIGLGQPKEAIAELEQDVRISPQASVSYFFLGQAHQQLKEYPQAKQSYAKALQLDPNYTEASFGLMTVCTRLGEKEEAAAYRQTFQKLKARDWKGLSDPRDALDQQKFLVSLSQGVAQTHTKVGLIYREQGHEVKAEERWRRAAELDPSDTVCREELASLHVEKGRDREALRVYEQLRQIAPKNPQYHLRIGLLYARLNRVDDALAAVRQALEIDPRNPDYRRIYEQIEREK